MKTAIYIEDGTVQLVRTPETSFEKSALTNFSGGSGLTAKIFNGTFYDCRGGWVRQSTMVGPNVSGGSAGDSSIIIQVRPETMPVE